MISALQVHLDEIEQLRNRQRKHAMACVAIFASTTIAYYYIANFNKLPQHTSSHTGRRWMEELLSGHPARMKDNLHISQAGFRYLENLLVRKSNFRDTRYMDTIEQLGIFLYSVSTDLSMRKLAERFQRSTETINRTFHKVMHHFLWPEFYKAFVTFPTESTPVPDYIEDNNSFFPYFKDCIGAVDGSHIPISPPENQRAPFRNRKGFLSQNVLAVCDFDAKFTMVLSGWEGSVADSTLWLEGRRIGALPTPEGKYLLGDAGFANCDTCITPYRGVRYHLKEWASANKSPQNKEELFNLRHSRLRNVIERSFGILKGRFKILTIPRAFKIEAQARIVPALCVLNNILINIREEIDLELEAEDPEDSDSETVQEHRGFTITNAESRRAGKKRDEISTAMWNDYQSRKASSSS
jgi:DDE superfamily endonuclease